MSDKLSETLAYDVSFSILVEKGELVDQEDMEESIRIRIAEQLSGLCLAEDDNDDKDENEDDKDEEELAKRRADVTEVVRNKNGIKVVFTGKSRAKAEIVSWLLENPGYATSKTTNGVRFGPMGALKSWEGKTLIDARVRLPR